MSSTTSTFFHSPVFLNESIDNLGIKEDGVYVDCTYGRGGHSKKILSKCKNLKVISRHGVGYDNVDLNYIKNIDKSSYFLNVSSLRSLINLFTSSYGPISTLNI